MVIDNDSKKSTGNIKFLCSYEGKIVIRPIDGKLRYAGGLTRVLAVERSISYVELMAKLKEFCGYSVTLRCQLPNGDLETLISVKSDEELASVIEEYDRAAPDSKIRAVLCSTASLKKISPSSSAADLSPKSPLTIVYSPRAIYGTRTSPMKYSSPAYSAGVRVVYCDARGHPIPAQEGNPRSAYSAPQCRHYRH